MHLMDSRSVCNTKSVTMCIYRERDVSEVVVLDGKKKRYGR